MRYLFILSIIACAAPECRSEIMPVMALDNTGTFTISGNTFTRTQFGLSDGGVTFNATLTVVGSGTTVSNNSTGLGVDGNTINDGESLTFSMLVSNIAGGAVTFNGFTALDFNSFTISGDDQGILSVDNSLATLGDNVTLTGDLGIYSISGSPTSFTVFGQPGLIPAGANTSFQLDSITVSFTGTAAVPEPSTSAAIAIGLMSLGITRRRKQVNKRNVE